MMLTVLILAAIFLSVSFFCYYLMIKKERPAASQKGAPELEPRKDYQKECAILEAKVIYLEKELAAARLKTKLERSTQFPESRQQNSKVGFLKNFLGRWKNIKAGVSFPRVNLHKSEHEGNRELQG
jgi:hypothetical protein